MSLASQSLHRLLHVVFLLRLLLSSSWAPKWYAKAVSSPKCQDVVWCWILAICLCLGGIFGAYYTTSGDKRPAAVTLSKRQDSLCKKGRGRIGLSGECSNHFISEDFEQSLLVRDSLLGHQSSSQRTLR